MGDSCYNFGMKKITKLVSDALGTYATCVATGDGRVKDTANGFFMTMDDNVDAFAERIRADPKLREGFNCVGFSQGNSLCRGYVQKYNDPPVRNFLSVHGTISGVAGFPNCDPQGPMGPACQHVAKLCGDLAYTQKTQDFLFQINYFRDPFRAKSDAYKTYSQLAAWNNEGLTFNQTYKDNFAKVQRFVLVKALRDSMVFPNEGEWFGHYADDSFDTVLTMRQTQWYQHTTIGLKSADQAGKILFNATDGDHLQFSDDQLNWWLTNLFV